MPDNSSIPTQPVIMVSSSVYGNEELLEQVFATLAGFGYQVWMSYKGTVPVEPRTSAFDSCLRAVARCDIFLGIITTFYGTGKEKGGLSITHRELLRAVELDKPRWFLAHDHVPSARTLLAQYRRDKRGRVRRAFKFERTAVMDDARVIDIYEAAIRHDVPLADRSANWVQPYHSTADAVQYVRAQFQDLDRVQTYLGRGRNS